MNRYFHSEGDRMMVAQGVSGSIVDKVKKYEFEWIQSNINEFTKLENMYCFIQGLRSSLPALPRKWDSTRMSGHGRPKFVWTSRLYLQWKTTVRAPNDICTIGGWGAWIVQLWEATLLIWGILRGTRFGAEEDIIFGPFYWIVEINLHNLRASHAQRIV